MTPDAKARGPATASHLTAVLAICLAMCPPAQGQETPTPAATPERPAQQRFNYHLVRGRQPVAASSGRYEGETDFELNGRSRVQTMRGFGDRWSRHAHLLWDGEVGQSMETTFDLEQAGVFDMTFQMTVAPDYGQFKLSLNGNVVRENIELYDARVDLAKKFTLKNVSLKAGRHSLKFQLSGSHPRSKPFRKGRLLGLDYMDLKRLKAADPDPTTLTPSDLPIATAEAVKPLDDQQLRQATGKYCFGCHRGAEPKGDLDLEQYVQGLAMDRNVEVTQAIRNAIHRGEMPPTDKPQPSLVLRRQLVSTFDAAIDRYLAKNSEAAPVIMRRLNRYEYNNCVRDLLQLRVDIYPLPEKTIRASHPYFEPASGRFPRTVVVGNRTLGKNQVEKQILTGVTPFAIDLQAEGGFNNRGNQLSVSPILLESFVKLGRSIVHSPEFERHCGTMDSLFRSPPDTDHAAQITLGKKRLRALLERAFRRPVEPETLDRYHRFFVAKLKAGSSKAPFTDAMKEVVAAILASPKFIYLVEEEVSPTNNREKQDAHNLLSEYELATRLSFFLWSSLPDESLLTAAQDGSLSNPQVLDEQVQRMLLDPRCQSLSQNFARQWLRLDQLITAVPDFTRFEPYYSRIGCEQWKFGLQTMIEPLLLFESIMVEDRSIMLLVDSNYSYRSPELQSWYRDAKPFNGRENRNRFNTSQQPFQRELLPNRREGGVMTSAATLTMTSAPLRTSPIARGAWVATVIFNQPPPPPPDVVPEIEADDQVIEARGLTLRQRLIQHQVNDSCVACHAKIDPLGFALENFDAVGRWRDKYRSGLEIDASGKLFGEIPFKDIIGLKDALLDHPEWFMRAFCEHMLSYALSRELEISDKPAVDRILAEVEAGHGQFTTVVRQIALSHPFRYRAKQ